MTSNSDTSEDEEDVEAFTKLFMSKKNNPVKNEGMKIARSGTSDLNIGSSDKSESDITESSDNDGDSSDDEDIDIVHETSKDDHEYSNDDDDDDDDSEASVIDDSEIEITDNEKYEEAIEYENNANLDDVLPSKESTGEKLSSPIDQLGEEKLDFVKLREQLSEMPFEDLEKLKEKVGMKMFNQAMFGVDRKSTKKIQHKPFKRENKNRPMEISSKKRPPKIARVVDHKKKVTRDPRFDDLSGAFSEAHFNKNYNFLSDMKQKEKKKLIGHHKKETDEVKKKQIEKLINNLNAEERASRESAKRATAQRELRKKERALVAEGKKPFYLKKSDQKTLALAEKYRELKAAGKVEKFLNKKRKKNASKDRKVMPSR